MHVTARPIANPLVVLREEFDDWAILFNPDTTDAVGINPMGVTLWKQMDGTLTVAQLAARVRATFADVPEAADAEIAEFVDGLAAKGLVGLQVSDANR
jgi:SynChlorMet cassette protein ScmD